MGLLSLFSGKKKSNAVDGAVEVVKQNKDLMPRSNMLTTDRLHIHPDLENLLWIADGSKKNYLSSKKQDVYNFSGVNITFSSMNQDEPSLIYTSAPLAIVENIADVERPPYYPTYIQLSPEQKSVYWKLLENPYNPNIDIGFVFILYYGLERHLLNGDYEKAFKVILKLRDVHNNHSFQQYSANALILTSLCKQRADLALSFMSSLDKEYELKFSDNLFLLCKYGLNIPLTAKDIMRLAKSFEFGNANYIKNYSELFEEILQDTIKEKYKRDSLLVCDFISSTDNRKIRKQSIPIFANISIIEKTVDVPLLIESFKFKKAMYDLLEDTHNQVRLKIAQLRKNGELKSEKEVKAKVIQVPTLDEETEKTLLLGLKKSELNFLDRHFSLMYLQDFYYKLRNADSKYLDKCIEYCMIDINSLEKMQESYHAEEINQIQKLAVVYSKDEIAQKVSGVKPFNGGIPAFKRLAIIYEKHKNCSKAIGICEQAIAYYNKIEMVSSSAEFEERKAKLLSKMKA
jgi:uncharacterized protein YdcH (DUF465 family)